jgi:hypothetical protein
LPSHWLAVHEDVAEAFGNLCAYTCMWLSSTGEVDHFVPVDEDRSKAYEWSNYRYAAGWFNSSKKALRSAQVLDPFIVEDDWFEILLPSLELRRTERCPENVREKADLMLDRLHLRNGSKVMRWRRDLYDLHKQNKVPPELLEQLAPLLARAIRKQEAEASPPLER